MMGDKSAIEWTDATWNPVTGCTKVSQGCKHCYAERVFPRPYPGRKFTDVQMHQDRLYQPFHWKKPRRIFVNSMSDLFHEDVTDNFLDQVLFTMRENRQHTFQVLTKRAARMQSYLAGKEALINRIGFPQGVAGEFPNVWWGVSVEDQATADERIPLLLQTPAAVRFLSCEPLLGPLSILRTLYVGEEGGGEYVGSKRNMLHWVIAGGESGPEARPSHPVWFRSLRDQCAAAGVAFFFKQWGEWRPRSHDAERIELLRGGDLPPTSAWPDGTLGHGDYRKNGGYGQPLFRIGKKAAGRQLDGRTHDEFPA